MFLSRLRHARPRDGGSRLADLARGSHCAPQQTESACGPSDRPSETQFDRSAAPARVSPGSTPRPGISKKRPALPEAFFFSSRRRHTRLTCDWSSDVCSSDLDLYDQMEVFSDERPPERKPVNIHAVLEHVKAVVVAGLSRPIPIREEYDPSLPPVAGSRDQLVDRKSVV